MKVMNENRFREEEKKTFKNFWPIEIKTMFQFRFIITSDRGLKEKSMLD